MRSWLRNNGLTLALVALFLLSLVGQAVTGFHVENEERIEHGQVMIGVAEYLSGGQFLSALFENWESEFLQMWAFVMLTAYLYQKGSPESRDPDDPGEGSDSGGDATRRNSPWPVRAGGVARKVYAHSLGLALLALFIISFALHWTNSARHHRHEAQEHGQPPPGLLDHLGSPDFWFESFQNWQSEFLSTAVLIVLAIYLRERGSPESKPVAAPHAQTGN
jgi:hypothetical protein